MLLGIFAGAVILAAMPDDGYALFGRLRVALVGCALVLGAAGFFGLVGQMVLSRAQNAAGQADWPVAARDAHRATSWLPWSPEPWQQLGEAQLAQGKPDAARASFRSAIEKDSGDWNLWFDLARASTGRAQADALAHAARLNPLSPEIAALRSELAAQ
jgi:tetratricopeptide (TPR) repeat protein